MKTVDKIYVNGAFIAPHGTEISDLINPATNQLIGKVTLGDEEDTRNAIAAAKAAFPRFSKTTREERINYLERLYAAVQKREEAMVAAMVEEYGGTLQFSRISTKFAINAFMDAIETLKNFEFERIVGRTKVRLEPVGVTGIITPWNASADRPGTQEYPV